MAKYKVLVRSFVNNAIVEEGATIEYDGIPSDNLEPIDNPAQSAAAQSDKANVKSIARQKAAAMGGDPDSVNVASAVDAAAKAAEAALIKATAASN